MAEPGSILNSRLDLLTFWNAAYRVLLLPSVDNWPAGQMDPSGYISEFKMQRYAHLF